MLILIGSESRRVCPRRAKWTLMASCRYVQSGYLFLMRTLFTLDCRRPPALALISQKFSAELGKTWNAAYKISHGPIKTYLEFLPELFVVKVRFLSDLFVVIVFSVISVASVLQLCCTCEG